MELDELSRLDEECLAAARAAGLAPGPTVFHLAPPERVYDVAARGLPGRYAHWRFGREYERLRDDYDAGRSRIYELVVNARPAQAYLLAGNSPVAQRLVIAHVYAHVDFFGRNRLMAVADARFLARVRAAAARIEELARDHGRSAVEDLIDAAEALAVHQPVAPLPQRAPEPPPLPADAPFDDLFPAERERRRIEHARELRDFEERVPREPAEDVLGFIAAHSRHLRDWEREVASIVREEAAYFIPQQRTKITNEGWATYWHERLLHDMALDSSAFVEFQRLHAGVVQPHPGTINPYSLGLHLWREVARIHRDPTDEERERWPLAGSCDPDERLREIAATYDDAALVAEFTTPNVCRDARLYAWRRDRAVGYGSVTVREADAVRDALVSRCTGLGVPRLVVVEADLRRTGALVLEHRDEGLGLDREYAFGTIPYLARLWGAPVFVRSIGPYPAGGGVPVWYACEPGQRAGVTHADPAG